MKQVTVLTLGLALLLSALACTREVEKVVVVTPTELPATATAQPLAVATSAPPTPLPDRTNCAEIKGTEYRSAAEREWYLANCMPTPAPTGQPPASLPPAPLAPPPAPASAGGRASGEVRQIATPMDQQACYQLGQADGAQDRSAGATLQLPPGVSPSQPGGTGMVMEIYKSPEGEVRTIVYWMEAGVPTIVLGIGGDAKASCGSAYIDGYRGVPFQQH